MENLALDLCSNFQRKVLEVVCRIPAGFVSTYACIAKKLSTSPRSIGRALATNPFPIIVPCHRIVKSDGSLGGYQGSAWMKKRLLESEGIKFDENDKILKRFIIGGLK
ncbi:MAG: MGMT family protein [Methanobacteriaceae archaeon]|nr:MGMT family protein [Methanobacteriaceae archaeon]